MNTAEVFKFPVKPEKPRMAELDSGYTKLANELLESLMCCDLTARQFRVMLALIRKTYGFGKKSDRISDSQLAEKTKLSRQNVNKAKNELLSMNYIILDGKKIGVNKEVSAWKNQSRDSVSNLKTKNVSNLETNDVSNLETHKRNTLKKKEINNISSENSIESPDQPPEKISVVDPDAVVCSPKGNKWGNADDLKAAQWIYSQVLIISPTSKEPNWSSWANDIRLMRQLDGYSHKDICRLFQWANRDSFWCSVVLSPAKLRKKWATLVIQSQQSNRNKRVVEQEPTQSWNTREAWENEFI
ncbi:replication protein [Providencia rettgeri]|uniref:replication protein n=1 Tax=Providencia rettgeri TaxID=587 RepID=UPI001BA74B5B|nr:replication protein [Providencia rettgeri]MBS0872130.1 replication protein [Providencia rettgeri]MBS0919276.1 replication protein [Providencia rettgeri]